MRSSSRRRAATRDDHCNLFVLIASTDLSPHRPARPPVDVFTSEGGAKEAFQRLRLQAGSSGWAQLVAVEEKVTRPICWFGVPTKPLMSPTSRPRLPRRRWVAVAIAVSLLVSVWASPGVMDRAGAAVAPHLSRTGLLTVAESQRAEATVCPGQHLTIAYSPPAPTRLRSVVGVRLVAPAVVDPVTHTFEVLDVDRGRTSVALSGCAGRSR